MDQDYDAVVIGSGLGGLTAAALYTHAGYRVLVLERNHSFGGAATTYHKGAMTVEASLHETTDPRATPDLKGEIFEALDLYKDIEFVPVGDFYQVRGPLIGEPLTIPEGIDAIEKRLVERFPEEQESIQRFLKQVDGVMDTLYLLLEHHDGRWWLAHGAELPMKLWPVVRDIRSSMSEVLQRYFGDNEALKFAVAANLCYYGDNPDTMSWLHFVVAQGGYLHGGGNYIKGGSRSLTEQLVKRVREGGGDALADHTAVEILLDDERTVYGVRYRPTSGGEDLVVRAPVVFGNAAPHVIEGMLPPAERDEFMAPYRDRPLSISLFSITFGLDRRPAELGFSAYSTFLIPEWVHRFSEFRYSADIMADKPVGRLPILGIVDYSCIDSGLSDGEVFPVNVVGVDRLENWSEEDYNEKREAWLAAIIDGIDNEWPGFAAAIVQKEMATARTMHEYLNTPGGALYGFAPVADKGQSPGPSGTAETSINGLWLASAFSCGGGLTGVMGAGAASVKAVLKHSV
jgi:phytoene dehydrogenase-like protein